MGDQQLWMSSGNGTVHVFQETLPPIWGRGLAFIIVCVLMPLIATAWTGMRIWTRRIRQLSPFMTEDIFCYAALISFWGVCICYILMVVLGGLGHHVYQLQPMHVERFSQALFTEEILYTLTLGFVKISIIVMIKRIFFTHSYAYIANIIMILSILWMVQSIATSLFICQPISINWDRNVRGHCGNLRLAFTAIGIVDILTDLLIFMLPIKLVLGLHMKILYRVALGCAFGGGLVTIAITSVRVYYLLVIDFDDLLYTCYDGSIMTAIQLGVAIMVASSPMLRPVMDRTLGRWFSIQSRYRSSNSNITPKSLSSNNTRIFNRGSVGPPTNQSSSEPRGSNAYRPMSESEEHLSWEMNVVHSERGKTETVVTRQQSDVESNGDGEAPLPTDCIRVTQSTLVS